MALLGALRAAPAALKNLASPLIRPALVNIAKPQQRIVWSPIRESSHRSMQMSPSRYEWNLWKDHAHFYFALGIIPIGLIITYCNIVIGDAELSETPDDYEPKHWEYYKHPIGRWFDRMFFHSPQQYHEMNLHVVDEEDTAVRWRRLQKRIEKAMKDKHDYKAWYFVPYNPKRIYKSVQETADIEKFQSSG